MLSNQPPTNLCRHICNIWGVLLLLLFLFFFFFSFFFFCVPSYISGVHHFGWDFCVCNRFFNPTIEVVTFHPRGWCMLGMFLLPAFTCLGHEWQGLLSQCNGMHVCTDYISVYTLIWRSVWGNGVRNHVNSKGKIPSTRDSEEVWARNAASPRTASPKRYQLSYSGPVWGLKQEAISLKITSCSSLLLFADRLVGLVVRRPPRERKIPGSNPACAWIFWGSSHTRDLKIGTPVATLPGAWRYRVSTETGRPGVSILWLGGVERLICNFYLSVAARKIVWADPSLRYTSLLLGR